MNLYEKIIYEQIDRYKISKRAASNRLNRLLDAEAGRIVIECIAGYEQTGKKDYLYTAKVILSCLSIKTSCIGYSRVVISCENADEIREILLEELFEELEGNKIDTLVEGLEWCNKQRDKEYKQRYNNSQTL